MPDRQLKNHEIRVYSIILKYRKKRFVVGLPGCFSSWERAPEGQGFSSWEREESHKRSLLHGYSRLHEPDRYIGAHVEGKQGREKEQLQILSPKAEGSSSCRHEVWGGLSVSYSHVVTNIWTGHLLNLGRENRQKRGGFGAKKKK